MTVWLDDQKYELVADSALPSGRRAFIQSTRPSDPVTDPGRIRKVGWKISGPLGQSRESSSGFLGVDYTDNVEHRYGDLIPSIAARNALTLTGLDPSGTGMSFGDVFGSGVFGPTYVASDVEFIEVVDRSRFRQRTWERGTGETLACGSGACAAAVVSMLRGVVDRKVVVELRGGELEIAWADDQSPVLMTGPAQHVFAGSIPLEEA